MPAPCLYSVTSIPMKGTGWINVSKAPDENHRDYYGNWRSPWLP
jgi:hypothetical protein